MFRVCFKPVTALILKGHDLNDDELRIRESFKLETLYHLNLPTIQSNLEEIPDQIPAYLEANQVSFSSTVSSRIDCLVSIHKSARNI